MSYEQDTATSSADLLNRLDSFLRKGHTLTPVYTGAGDGRLTNAIGTAASVLETITVTFTGATTFTVEGSVTGAMGAGTVGVAFAHAVAGFTVTAGATPWAAGDTISVLMTPPWQQKRGIAGSEYIWQAPGNDGLSQILVGASRFFDLGANYDNWRLGGFTGYDAGSTFTTQAGAIGIPSPVLPLWNSNIPYWFVANGRRVAIVAKVSASYESAYLGLLNAYASPGQWPYPLVVGGSMAWNGEPALTSASWRYSYVGTEHAAYPWSHNATIGTLLGQMRLRRPDGTWLGFRNEYRANSGGAIWPYTATALGASLIDLRPNFDGSYPMFPVVLTEDTGGGTNVYGELDGVRATTGHANASENTIIDGRDVWLVVQNITGTTKREFYALRLD